MLPLCSLHVGRAEVCTRKSAGEDVVVVVVVCFYYSSKFSFVILGYNCGCDEKFLNMVLVLRVSRHVASYIPWNERP